MNLVNLHLTFKSLSLATQWQMTKAKRAYLKTHPVCAVCGNEKYLEVHHCLPVHLFPDLACDSNNFITLCDGPTNCSCHNHIGHFGNFRTKYNLYIRECAISNRIMMIVGGNKDIIQDTNKLIQEFAASKNMTDDMFLFNVLALNDISVLNAN